MAKHISKIADDWMMYARELQGENEGLYKENQRLESENKDLREALKHCQQRTYADDLLDDDDSEGAAINAALDGVGR